MMNCVRLAALLALFANITAGAPLFAADGRWKEDIIIDHLTDEKIIRMANTTRPSIRQFGRRVVATLVVQCINPFRGDYEKYRDEDYLSGFINFSEKVGVGDVLARYRFDNGIVREEQIGISDRGDYFQLSSIKQYDEFIPELRKSSRLRVEIHLPWAGDVLLDFPTSGADEALKRIPCGSTRGSRPSVAR